jgi:hypothetical protein
MPEPKPDPTVSLEHPLVLGLPGTWEYDQDHGGWGRQEAWLPSDGEPEPENCRGVGIGYDRPVPPAEERPFGGLTARLRRQVRFVVRAEFAEEGESDG